MNEHHEKCLACKAVGCQQCLTCPDNVFVKANTAAQEREAKLQAEIEHLKEMWKSAEDANIKVAGRLAEFRDDNAKLKAEIKKWERAGTSTNNAFWNENTRAEKLEAENTKLRELVERLNKALDESREHSAKLRDVVERLRDYVAAWSNFSNGEPEAKNLLAESADVLK